MPAVAAARRLCAAPWSRHICVVSAAPFPLPLVGRAAETALLADALGRAAAGHGGLLVLAGEGGVGKTRLVQWAQAEAERRGFATAVGRAYAVETGVPYALWADALLPLLRALDPAALAVLTRGGEGELAQLFPALAAGDTRPRAAAGPPATITAEHKAQLHWRLAQLLGTLAGRRPLLLVLENLQWADASSLELLHFVARQLGGAGVLLLASYNDAERDLNPLLRTTEQSLVALGAARVHHVPPLGLEDTVELLRRAFGAEPAQTAAFAALLYGWTRGHPFFIEETMKALVEGGRLVERDGRWTGWAVDALALPRSIREAVLARLARLSPPARELANLAAVLGRRVRWPVLRTLAALDEPALLAALDELVRQQVLVESAEGEGDAYDFAHPILQDVLYGELGRARALLLHASVAEALETYYGRRAAAHADELAFHFARGAPHVAAPRAVRYLAMAGRSALAKHANREAASYLERALELMERDGAGGAGGAPDDDAGVSAGELVELLARARQRLGEYDEATALWVRARDEARATGDRAREARVERQLGLACYWSGRHEAALAHYDAGLAAAEAAADDDAVVRLRLARGNCLLALGRHAEGGDETRRALAVAERLGDAALLARVHRALLLLHAWTGPPSAAREHGARALELAGAAGQTTVAWSAHWGLAVVGGLTGHAPDIAHHLAESDRLADQLQSPLLRLWNTEVAIEYLAGVGEWRTALDRGEQSIAAARLLGQRTLLPRLLVWSGLLLRDVGDMERAQAHLEEAWELAGAGHPDRPGRDVHVVVPAHTGMTGYHLARGDWARAVEVGERGLAIADRSGYIAWSVYRLLPFVIESALWLGDHARATRHGERLRVDAGRLGHALGLAWATTFDGILAWLTGPPARAAVLLPRAVAELEAVPFVFDAARVRRMVAHALVATGDREGAARELRLAHDAFARLGAERELAGTRERLRELGVRPPVKAVSAGTAGMTGRELEIARLVAQRQSNKEIAARLDVSPRTVSTHLSNIFAKLGVESRGALADFVREEGLLDAE